MRRLVVLLLAGHLGACTSFVGDAAGNTSSLGVGAAVGAATGNPFIGLLAGLATSFAIDAGVDYAERALVEEVHDAIAESAGRAPIDQWRSWVLLSEVGQLNNAAGRLVVTREFADPPCRELIYTDALDDPNYYTATICENQNGVWKWAVSEPATKRWGYLQ